MIKRSDPVEEMARAKPPLHLLAMLGILLIADYMYFTTLVGMALNVGTLEKHLISLGCTMVTILLMQISASCFREHRASGSAERGRLIVGIVSMVSYAIWVVATAWFRLNSETGQDALQSMGDTGRGSLAQQISNLGGAASASAEATTFLMTVLLLVTGIVAFASSYAFPNDKDSLRSMKAKDAKRWAGVSGGLAALDELEDKTKGRVSNKLDRAARSICAEARYRAVVTMIKTMSDPSEGRYVVQAIEDKQENGQEQ